nr:hypothetical protein [Tanacetum cinerariifolium]
MRTRRSYFSTNVTIPRRRRKQISNIVEPEIRTIVEMADNRTMAQMLQALIKGFEDAIVVPPINANNFELKQTLINLVQKLHQLDTFYNALNPNDQDALDSAAEGNFLDKIPRDGLSIIRSKSKVRYSQSRVTDSRVSTDAPLLFSSHSNSFELQQIAASLEDKLDIRMSRFEKSLNDMKAFVTSPAPIKAVEEVCVTCGANHSYNHCPLTRGGNEFPIFHDNIQQFQTPAIGNFVQGNRHPNLSSQMRSLGFNQPNQQNNQNNQNRYQGNNFNPNHNQNRGNNQGVVYQNPPQQASTFQAPVSQNSVANNKFEAYTKANDANMNNLEIILRDEKQSLTLKCGDTPSILESLNKVDLIDVGESDFYSEEIENYLNDDSIPIGVENSAKSSIEEPEYSFSMGDSDDVTSNDKESIHDVPIEESKVFSNPLFDNDEINSDELEEEIEIVTNTDELLPPGFKNDDSKGEIDVVEELHSIHDVPIEESKVFSNPLFDNDEINSDDLESHVESNFAESLSTHDALIDSSQKIDHLKEFSRPLMPIHIVEEERIRREHAEYISRMEMLFTINPRPCLTVNANMIVESIPSSLIPVQDNDSQREEIEIVTNTDELLPPGFENDDSKGEIDVVEELHVDNSISNSKNEFSDNEASDFDNPSVPRPPSEPPDAEFDFKPNTGEEILVVINTIDELECLNPRDEFDVSTNDDDHFPFMFVIRSFLPYLIYFKVFPFLLCAESEDTIFDPGILV